MASAAARITSVAISHFHSVFMDHFLDMECGDLSPLLEFRILRSISKSKSGDRSPKSISKMASRERVLGFGLLLRKNRDLHVADDFVHQRRRGLLAQAALRLQDQAMPQHRQAHAFHVI